MLSAACRAGRAFYVRLISLTETKETPLELNAGTGGNYGKPNLRESLSRNVSPVLSVVEWSVRSRDCRVGFTQASEIWERGLVEKLAH